MKIVLVLEWGGTTSIAWHNVLWLQMVKTPACDLWFCWGNIFQTVMTIRTEPPSRKFVPAWRMLLRSRYAPCIHSSSTWHKGFKARHWLFCLPRMHDNDCHELWNPIPSQQDWRCTSFNFRVSHTYDELLNQHMRVIRMFCIKYFISKIPRSSELVRKSHAFAYWLFEITHCDKHEHSMNPMLQSDRFFPRWKNDSRALALKFHAGGCILSWTVSTWNRLICCNVSNQHSSQLLISASLM